MMSKRSGLILLFAAYMSAAALAPHAAAQSAAPPRPGVAAAVDLSKLGEEERRLVAGSRAALLSLGLSEGYFDRHFSVAKVVNTAGDRRVVWRFAVGEHAAFVNDSVGYYTDQKGRRVNTHSVAASLGAAREIRRTITRRRAERLMRDCIGPFEGGSVIYRAVGTPPRAALVFSASSAAPAAPAGPNNQTPPPAAAGQSDTIRAGGKKPPPPVIGAVDLQTGRCVTGYALSGAYPPLPAPRRRD
jgi:hypothetical protein